MPEKTFTTLFLLGMWWRIIYGAMRIVLGLALLHVVGQPLLEVLTNIMQHELLERTPDILFTFLEHALTAHQFDVTYFLASYFIFWGSVDAVLSYHMLRDDIWAFPIAIVLIGLFICYSIFRLTYTHSHVLFGVIILDVFILTLIYKEYQKVKARLATTTQVTSANQPTI